MKYLVTIFVVLFSSSIFANIPFDNFLGSYRVKEIKCTGDNLREEELYLDTFDIIKYENGMDGNSKKAEYWVKLSAQYIGWYEQNISDYYLPSLLGKYGRKVEYVGDENSASYIETIPSSDIPTSFLLKYEDQFGSFRIQEYKINKAGENYNFTVIRRENSLKDINTLLSLDQCDYVAEKIK